MRGHLAGKVVMDEINVIVAELQAAAQLFWDAFKKPFDAVFVGPFTAAWDTLAEWFNTATGFVSKVAGYIGGLPKKAWDLTSKRSRRSTWPRSRRHGTRWPSGSSAPRGRDQGGRLHHVAAVEDRRLRRQPTSRVQNIFSGAGVGAWISGIVTTWGDFIAALPGKIADFGKDLLGKISGFVENAGIGTFLSGKVQAFADLFFSLPGKIGDALAGGVKGAIGKIKGWFATCSAGCPAGLKNILGIHSPSTVFAEIGEHIVGGLIQGLGNMAGALKDKVESIVGAPINWAKKLIGGLLNFGSQPQMEQIGNVLARGYQWQSGPNWEALVTLWQRESGWDPHAENPSSHAYGIPQALPSTKMPQAAWPERAGGRSDPQTQIAWGLAYIKSRYGDPLRAWQFWQGHNWYAQGGIFTKPSIIGVGEAGPEAVIPLSKMRGGVNITVNMPNYLGDTRQAAQAIRAELQRIGRNNDINPLAI